MPLLSDVAEKAKVSLMTVSRVVNGDKKVKKETRERVQQAIKALGYQPNAMAQALSSKRTMNIGLILPKIEYVLSEPYFCSLIYSLEKALSLYHYNLLIDSSEHRNTQNMSVLYERKKVDGLIIVGSVIDDERISMLSKKQIPSVLVHARSSLPGLSFVDLDNYQIIDCLLMYLQKLGHRRIGFITGDLTVLNAYDRLIAYKRRLKLLGLDLSQELVYEGDWSSISGYNSFSHFNNLSFRPTAVLSSNDHMAIGFIKAATDHGVSIPNDISLVGIDDIEMASFTTPKLTTIRQPMHNIANMTVEALIRSINAESPSGSQIILNAELVERDSCAPVHTP